MDEMNDFRSLSHGFICFEQLGVVDDINDLGLWIT